MKKVLYLIISCFCILLLCSCTEGTYMESLTPTTSATLTSTPATSPSPTSDGALSDPLFDFSEIVACTTIADDSDFPDFCAILLMYYEQQPDNRRYDMRLLVETGEPVTEGVKRHWVDFYDVWEAFADNGRGKLTLVKTDSGYLIMAKRTIGHGNADGTLIAYFDGEKLHKVNWPFNDWGYYGSEVSMFNLEWTGDATYNLKCNLNGEVMHYEVNVEHYENTLSGKFSDFEKTDKNSGLIDELLISDMDEAKKELVVQAWVNYGEDLITAVLVDVTLKFDAVTHSMVLKSVEYTIIDNAVFER